MGTNFNYDDADHQLIYNDINGGASSGPLQETSRAWQRLADDVGVTAKEYVVKAIRSILVSREGVAAEAATTGTATMLPWLDDAAVTAQGAAQRVQNQAEHWVTAKDSVPPVPPAPLSTDFLANPTEWFAEKMDWFPGLTTEEEKAQQRQQDTAEQARQAMRVYQTSSNGNLDSPPVFTAPQPLDGTLGAPAPADPRVNGGGARPGVAGPAGWADHQPVDQPVDTAAQLASGQTGPGRTGAPGSAGWAGNPIPGQGGAPGQGITPGLVPFGPGPGGGVAAENARPGSVRPGVAGGGRFPVPDAGRGRVGPRPGAGGADFGPGPGIHPAPNAAGGARAGAASAGAGRGSGAGVFGAPLGAGTGTGHSGDQDHEYRRKYLIESNANAIVGELPPAAPPVIGVDRDD